MSHPHRRACMSLLMTVLGNLLYALSVKLFLLPSGLPTGGTTGIALAVQRFTGLDISAFVLIFNIVMLLVGLAILGKKFAATTVLSSFLYPMWLEALDLLLGDVVLTRDPMLNTLFFGVGIGVALGMVIRSGASTGGMDIPPLVLNKLFHIPVSVSLYAFDTAILLLQALADPGEKILYGVIMIPIYSFVLDKMLILGQSRIEVKVVSREAEAIRRAILSQVDRGVTMLDGEGGYTGRRTQVILSVISSRELPLIEKLVHDIDPESFMVVSKVSEVRGRGFTLSKQYHDK